MRQNDFAPMADIIPEAQLDGCAVEHFDVDEHSSMLTQIQAMQHGPASLVPPGRYCRLKVGRTLMMSDTPAEQRSNIWFVVRATGDVFIAGLGLGMVLIPVLRKEGVRSVTVIEKYQAVIDLVEPSIRKRVSSSEGAKLTVICEDIFDWKLPKGQKWETIYFDIWPDICGDNLPEITKLKRRFARRLRRDNKAAWMGAWEEHTIRRHMRGSW